MVPIDPEFEYLYTDIFSEIDKVDKHIEEATDDLTALKEETDIKDKIQGNA